MVDNSLAQQYRCLLTKKGVDFAYALGRLSKKKNSSVWGIGFDLFRRQKSG